MFLCVQEPLEQREDYIQFYPAVEETTELMRILRDYGLFRYIVYTHGPNIYV
jgi:hypothetical protein